MVVGLYFLLAKSGRESVAQGKPIAQQPEKPSNDPPVTGKLSGQQIYEKVLKSTVWINNPGIGSGSGALINAQERLVITNYHVVFGNRNLPAPLRVFNATLTGADPREPIRNHPHKSYKYSFRRKKIYWIDMESRQFDSYLIVQDTRGNVLAADDDGGGVLNARIRFEPPHDGTFQIIATSFNGGAGNFSLRISEINLQGGLVSSDSSVASFVWVNFPTFQDGKPVADKEQYLKANDADPEKNQAKVVASSSTKDLAVLQLNSLPEGIQAMPLARESCRPGQLVHSIGNPGSSGALWV